MSAGVSRRHQCNLGRCAITARTGRVQVGLDGRAIGVAVALGRDRGRNRGRRRQAAARGRHAQAATIWRPGWKPCCISMATVSSPSMHPRRGLLVPCPIKHADRARRRDSATSSSRRRRNVTNSRSCRAISGILCRWACRCSIRSPRCHRRELASDWDRNPPIGPSAAIDGHHLQKQRHRKAQRRASAAGPKAASPLSGTEPAEIDVYPQRSGAHGSPKPQRARSCLSTAGPDQALRKPSGVVLAWSQPMSV